jgi:hypothetical protein
VLDEPGFRARAGAIAADMRAHDAANEGAALIEELLVARARGAAA